MHVLVTYKNEEDQMTKMKVLEWQQHFSHCKSLAIIPAAQGQLTPQSQVRAGKNSSKLLWLSSIPARMKKIKSKMKALESGHNCEHRFSDANGQLTPCSQHFSHYKSMGIFPEVQGKLNPQTLVRAEFRPHPRFYSCPCNL